MTVDCIMLSYTKNKGIHDMTQRAIDSLHASSDIKFRVLLIETSEDMVLYDNASVIKPHREFNYNAFVNIGLARCDSEWVIIANNDVIFHKGFMEEILKENPDSASPRCDVWDNHLPYIGANVTGYRVGIEVCGWCIVAKRKVLEDVGFDERMKFWYQDNLYAFELKRKGYVHKLIGKACVTHLRHKSYSTIKNFNEFTIEAEKVFKDLTSLKH